MKRTADAGQRLARRSRRGAPWVVVMSISAACHGAPELDVHASPVTASPLDESPAASRRASPAPAAWRPIAGLPAHCGARVAVDATRVVPPLQRRACASGRPGCFVLGGDAWLRVGSHEAAFADAHGVHVNYRRPGPEHGTTLSVVQRLEGAAEVVFLSPPEGCTVVGTGSRHGLAMRAVLGAGDAEAAHYRAWSSWAAITALTAVPTAPDDTPLSVRRSSSIAVEVVQVGDHATLVELGLDGLQRTIVEAEADADIIALAVDRTRDDTLVWTERDASGASTLRAFDRDAGPRTLAEAWSAGPIVANAGAVLGVASPEHAHVVRIDDGDTTTVVAEPDAAWTQPLWIDDEHLAIVVSPPLSGEQGDPTPTAIVQLVRP